MRKNKVILVPGFFMVICAVFVSCSKNKSLFRGGVLPEGRSVAAAASDVRKIDVDLSVLSATMVYAEVFNMLIAPDDYDGKTVRVNGTFSSFIPNGMTERVYTVVVSDALACCQQGLEFKLGSEMKYPEDFPALESEIEVTGRFVMSTTPEGYDYFYLLCDGIKVL